MSDNRFARVGDILPAVIKSIGLDQKIKELELLKLWPAVVGRDIAARTEAVKVEDGVLHVRVEHGAWMQELHFLEREIIERLREECPEVKIHRIRFGTGR